MPEDNARHTEVWEAIDTLRGMQTESQKEISGLSGVVKQLIEEVRDLKGIIHRPQDKFNWVGFGALVVGVLMCAGAYSNAIIKPITDATKENANWQKERMQQLPDDYYQFGQNSSRLDIHDRVADKVTDTLYDHTQDIATALADIEMLKRWLQDVDGAGSRKHIIGVPEVITKEKSNE